MKVYELTQLTINKKLGTVSTSDKFENIELILLPSYNQTYSKVLIEMLKDLKESRLFPQVNINGLNITDGSKDFWITLKQNLLLYLDVVVS